MPARSWVTTTGARARGSNGWLAIGALRANPPEERPLRGISGVPDEPRMDNAMVLVGVAASPPPERASWWNRRPLTHGEKKASHSANGSNTFSWNPMNVQSVQVGY